LETYFLQSGYKCTFISWKCKVHTEVVWGEVSVVTGLWAGKQKFWLIAGRSKRYFFPP